MRARARKGEAQGDFRVTGCNHNKDQLPYTKSRKLAPWSLRELLFTKSFLGASWPAEALLLDISRTFRAAGGGGGPPPNPSPVCLKNQTLAVSIKGGGGGPPLPPSSGPPPPHPPRPSARSALVSLHCSMLVSITVQFIVARSLTVQFIVARSLRIRLQGRRTTFAS